jgi:hypothetical protein
MKQLLILLLFPTALFAQGPLDGYLKGKGVLDLAPSFSVNTAQTFAGADNRIFDEGFQGSTVSLFAEYGVTNNFDLVATGSYIFTANNSGLQDGALLAKYRPVYADFGKKGRLGILMGLGATFPLSDYEVVAAGALGQKAVTAPARLIVQYESPWGVFFNLTGGYNWRLDNLKEDDIAVVRRERPDYQPINPANFSTFLFKIGFPAKHYYIDAWVEQQNTQGGADYVPNLPDLPQAYGVTYTQAGGTLYYSDNGKTGFFLSGGHIFRGRNVSRITRLTAGVVIKI